ncbi:sensor histidine kinase [Symbioplanes lichenis]|uniref:sensor histidine kinase n=1 Tax=Symbioplanes lichenis TaxID=1629072 RepID=UPI0027390C68|nr:HAMP domain-containing sensor histidine kinase [Actinoplanes lichenis]
MNAVPLHRSLLTRLLAASLLIALCAIAATAWLSVQLTKRAVTHEQSRTLSADTDIYDALIEYAATHDSWDGAGSKITRLGELTRSRIALTTPGRTLIAGSSPDAADAVAVSEVPTATVDPLFLDPGIARVSGGRIDPRAVGPYRLTGDERRALRQAAEDQIDCLSAYGIQAEVVDTPSGRPTVRQISAGIQASCPARELATPVASEREPLQDLSARMAECGGPVKVTPQFTVAGETDGSSQMCLDEARRAQLQPYVAPPALLFVTGQAVPAPSVDLSPGNRLRIVATAAAVLVVACAVTVVAGLRLVRPLRVLTAAARRPVESQQAVPVTTRDEIGYLATAFNDLAERRQAVERQRQAMVNDIAHELRTPLTTIRTWLETARDGAVPVDAEVLDLLVEEAVLLHHVVDDLRDLAAAEAGNLRVHPSPTYVKDLLEQVLDAHRTAAVTLALHASGDPEVTVDPVRLRQIVGNLVSNAVRHTPPGGSVTVDLSVRESRLRIAVTDTGTGISAEDLPKVFDRFWRADTSRTRATGGSGLGLAIARQLARAHGGDVTALSTPGIGSTFTVDIPVQVFGEAPE